MNQPISRYQKQILYSPIGEEGQRQIRKGRALLCGCGALGSVLADQLVRAGIGFLRIVDRDFVDMTNLQRQVLFDEADVESNLPKVIAASKKLNAINSEVEIDPIVANIDSSNILKLLDSVDIILDGTDNFETRFLINDASLETGIPWINGGCLGTSGQVMTVFPNQTACLRCLMEDAPTPGSTETCDTAGILGPTVNIVASMQAIEALKILSGNAELVSSTLTMIDVWNQDQRKIKLDTLRENSNCPACVQGKRDWLNGEASASSTKLCGRNSVQITPAKKESISFEGLAKKLESTGKVSFNPYLLKAELGDSNCTINLFKDGRAIIQGTEDESMARSLYARYIGH